MCGKTQKVYYKCQVSSRRAKKISPQRPQRTRRKTKERTTVLAFFSVSSVNSVVKPSSVAARGCAVKKSNVSHKDTKAKRDAKVKPFVFFAPFVPL